MSKDNPYTFKYRPSQFASIPTPTRQLRRRLLQSGFFLLFLLAPVLDIFRLDLNLGHFIFFGQNWTLGLDPLIAGEASIMQALLSLLLRGLLPLLGILGLLAWVAWKYGRLYCGWLCPHFSVVESINGLLRRTTGKPTLWEHKALPTQLPNGKSITLRSMNWFIVALAIIGFAFLWAVAVLTYLLPPTEIYHNIFNLTLTRNQSLFLLIASAVFALDFLFARHLFCRFGCAVGLYQSFFWMANKKGQVVGLDHSRLSDCKSCNAACEHACSMRLKPRSIKRKMFTCTACGQCLSACEQVQAGGPGNSGKIQTSLLQWQKDECALNISKRSNALRPANADKCFKR